jgi:hypothetical protein
VSNAVGQPGAEVGGGFAEHSTRVADMSRTVRVTVRGSFDALSAAQRSELLAEAAEHDSLHIKYTSEGYLAYDVAARPFFTFRFAGEVAEESEIPALTGRCEAAVAAWMTGRGYRFKGLSAQAVDQSAVPLGKRGRRLAAGEDA